MCTQTLTYKPHSSYSYTFYIHILEKKIGREFFKPSYKITLFTLQWARFNELALAY